MQDGPISPVSEDFPVWSRKIKYPSPLSYINGKSPVQDRDGWVLALFLFLLYMGLDVSVYEDPKKNSWLKFSHYYLTVSQVG